MSLRLAFMGSPDFAVPTLEAHPFGGARCCVRLLPAAASRRPGGKSYGGRRCMRLAARHGIEVRTPMNFKGRKTATPSPR